MTRNVVERPPAEQWSIQKLVPGGDGFTRLADGRAAFATGALPGDLIRPLRIKERPGFVRAVEWELVRPGADRVEPPCPVADACGGCGLMRLSTQAQLSAKAEMLREALRRTGRFHELPEPIPIVTAGSDLGYRQRLRLHVDESGRLGLFARGTHRLVVIPSCVVCRPELDAALHELRGLVERDPAALPELASEIEIRMAPAGPPIVLVIAPRRKAELSARARALLDVLESRFSLSFSGVEREDPPQRFPLSGGLELLVPADAFVQVNWAVNEKLVEAVVLGARERAAKRFCDVYCGAGNFALPLLAAGLSGVGIDRSRSGIDAARSVARAADLSASFVAGDASELLGRLADTGEQFDLLLLDPPRAGAEREVLAQVKRLRPAEIAMCSCDAPSLARDMRSLCDAGYALTSVTGFDMFPHTFQLEALAWLARSS